MVVQIRPYHRADREAILRIAADITFFGEPVEAFLPDRRIMQDAFVRCYTDCESEYPWIADVDGASTRGLISAHIPAHLHVNLSDICLGLGLGRRLRKRVSGKWLAWGWLASICPRWPRHAGQGTPLA